MNDNPAPSETHAINIGPPIIPALCPLLCFSFLIFASLLNLPLSLLSRLFFGGLSKLFFGRFHSKILPCHVHAQLSHCVANSKTHLLVFKRISLKVSLYLDVNGCSSIASPHYTSQISISAWRRTKAFALVIFNIISEPCNK